MKIRIAAIADVGKERSNQEDALLVCPDLACQEWHEQVTTDYLPISPSGTLLIAADGMGGANAGEVASGLAVSTFKKIFTPELAAQAIDHEELIEGMLSDALSRANDAILKHMEQDFSTDGMGTTLVVCWVIGNKAHVLWCGDSRCYLYRPCDGGLRRLTKDHSLVQEMIDRGEITEEEAQVHPDSNIITQVLGDFTPQPDVSTCDVQPGDLLLLCSDGLCGYCSDDAIATTLKKNYRDAEQCKQQLLKQALDAGGHDNICIVLASLIGDEDCAPKEEQDDEKSACGIMSFFRKLFGSSQS